MKKHFKVLLNFLWILLFSFPFTLKAQNKNDVIGTWSGAFGKKQLEIEIIKIKGDSIYGKNTVGKNTRNIIGTYIVNDFKVLEASLFEPGDNKYDGVFNINFQLNDNTAKGNWKIFKGASKRNFTLKKRLQMGNPKVNVKLLEGLKGEWEGIMRYKDELPFYDVRINITNVTKDSLFLHFKTEKNGKSREFYSAGNHKIKNENGKSFPVVFTRESKDKSFNVFYGTEVNFKYLKNKIEGAFVANDIILDIELKKTLRIKQSATRVKEINERITKLEVEFKKLTDLFDEILHYGRLRSFSTVKKAREQMILIDEFTKKNGIPADNKLLTYKQQKRMDKIKEVMINYRTNSKLVKLLN